MAHSIFKQYTGCTIDPINIMSVGCTTASIVKLRHYRRALAKPLDKMVRLVAHNNRSTTVDFRTRSPCFWPRIIQPFINSFLSHRITTNGGCSSQQLYILINSLPLQCPFSPLGSLIFSCMRRYVKQLDGAAFL